ncbi:HAD family hydrolase [Polyangium sp. y55x31]|uniref:HAD family hydrolase n=1 Tax=Polyangium sp. y55x31 TaxID=3042688 RepID=UPI002482E981|nr:HAD family hydrolase [Polyangium sp. y55x31]MDI1476295.1 HAD family hydrolase [Polyangium sp. y55x31]
MKCVAIFDLDGTLIDTPRAIVATFSTAFAAMGFGPPSASTIRATIGLPLEQAFSELMRVPLDDMRVTHGITQYQIAFRDIVLPHAEALLIPGVAEGLPALRDQGLTLAVATSKFHASADALLKAAGLRSHFDVVVGADQVARPKPDPEMGQRIMRTLGVPAERAVMVGDTTHDVWMARAAGMRSVAVTYGVHGVQELSSSGPTWVVDTFEDVLKCLRTGLLPN